MIKIFDKLSKQLISITKKYNKFVTEDLIRFLFIKNLCNIYNIDEKNITIEKPYLYKPKSISQQEEERFGIIDFDSKLKEWIGDKSRTRLDLYFTKNKVIYCFEFKYFKYGTGWAPDTCFGSAINDLHRLSLLKQYSEKYECYFLYAFDDRSGHYFDGKYTFGSFYFKNPEGDSMKAIDIVDEIENKNLKEIKKNSILSFKKEKNSTKYSTDFKNEVLNQITYKIMKRASLNGLNLVLIKVSKSSSIV